VPTDVGQRNESSTELFLLHGALYIASKPPVSAQDVTRIQRNFTPSRTLIHGRYQQQHYDQFRLTQCSSLKEKNRVQDATCISLMLMTLPCRCRAMSSSPHRSIRQSPRPHNAFTSRVTRANKAITWDNPGHLQLRVTGAKLFTTNQLWHNDYTLLRRLVCEDSVDPTTC